MIGMSKPCRIDPITIRRARAAAADAQSAEELRCAQAILLPALTGVTWEETAALLGVGRASIPRLQVRFRQRATPGKVSPRNWGGRRRALLTMAQEKAFLEPWVEQAKEGRMLVVSSLRAAFSQRVGRAVAATVVYRMLERHGWRKVAPDTRHPKADPKAQEDWKKNSRKYWQISCVRNP
jgi:transposase